MKTKKELALIELTEIENRQRELRRIIEEVETPKNIMDRVKTFEDACKILGEHEDDLPYSNPKNKKQKSINAFHKLETIIRALNKGWIPNWNNSNEYKHYPYFSVGSGFGFSGSSALYVIANTAVGSRLCFKSRELSDYAGKTFIKEYREFML